MSLFGVHCAVFVSPQIICQPSDLTLPCDSVFTVPRINRDKHFQLTFLLIPPQASRPVDGTTSDGGTTAGSTAATVVLAGIVPPVALSPSPETAPPAAGGGGAAGFLWWPIIVAVGGAALMACIALFIAAKYRRRRFALRLDGTRNVPQASSSSAATETLGPETVHIELSEVDNGSSPTVHISLAD